ncbi:MAG: hypothetical protein B7L53_04805 [Thermofilum sp. NZ13]|nr:MAG: hypothetical protein B7L53_04805 [Thermofilum sp. NZ13]
MIRVRLGRVLGVVGSIILATWLILLAIVVAAESVARLFTGVDRSVVGLGVFLAFLALAVALAEALRVKVLPKLISARA